MNLEEEKGNSHSIIDSASKDLDSKVSKLLKEREKLREENIKSVRERNAMENRNQNLSHELERAHRSMSLTTARMLRRGNYVSDTNDNDEKLRRRILSLSDRIIASQHMQRQKQLLLEKCREDLNIALREKEKAVSAHNSSRSIAKELQKQVWMQYQMYRQQREKITRLEHRLLLLSNDNAHQVYIAENKPEVVAKTKVDNMRKESTDCNIVDNENIDYRENDPPNQIKFVDPTEIDTEEKQNLWNSFQSLFTSAERSIKQLENLLTLCLININKSEMGSPLSISSVDDKTEFDIESSSGLHVDTWSRHRDLCSIDGRGACIVCILDSANQQSKDASDKRAG